MVWIYINILTLLAGAFPDSSLAKNLYPHGGSSHVQVSAARSK